MPEGDGDKAYVIQLLEEIYNEAILMDLHKEGILDFNKVKQSSQSRNILSKSVQQFGAFR